MEKTRLKNVLKTTAMGYRCAHPESADLDLRIFQAVCAGQNATQITSEIPCDIVTLTQSLCRMEEYLHSASLPDIASLFMFLFSVRFENDGAPTPLLEALYHARTEGGLLSPNETRVEFDHLHKLVEGLPFTAIDDLIATVCQLCGKHERAGFLDGVRVGYRLSTELHL